MVVGKGFDGAGSGKEAQFDFHLREIAPVDGLCRLQTVQGGEAKCRLLHFLRYGRCTLVDMHEKRHPRMIQRLEQQRQHLGRGVCDDEKGVAFVGLHKRQEERSEAHSTHLCEKVLESGIGEEVMFGS